MSGTGTSRPRTAPTDRPALTRLGCFMTFLMLDFVFDGPKKDYDNFKTEYASLNNQAGGRSSSTTSAMMGGPRIARDSLPRRIVKWVPRPDSVIHRSSDEDDYESELPMTIDNWVIKGLTRTRENSTKFSKTASGKSDIRHDLGFGLTPSHSNMLSATCRIWPCAIVFVTTSRLSQSDDTLGKYIHKPKRPITKWTHFVGQYVVWNEGPFGGACF